MEKQDFIRFIKENIGVNNVGVCHLNEQKQQEIDDYLNGKINDIKVYGKASTWYTVGFRECQEKIMQEIKTENKEVAKRAFNFIKKYEPNMFAIYYSYLNYRYKIYYEVEMDKESVLEDILNNIYAFTNTVNCNYYTERKLNIFIKDIENTNNEQKSDLFYMFEYYSELIDDILFNNNDQERCVKVVQLILGALCIEFYKNDTEKMNKYLRYTEKNIYGLLKNIYGDEELERIYSLYFDDNKYIDYFKTIPILDIKFNKSLLNRMLLFVSKSFRKYSDIINCEFKLCMIEIDSNFYLEEYSKSSYEDIKKYYQEFNLPCEFFIKLYLNSLDKFQIKGYNLIENLEGILQKNQNTFIEHYNILKEGKDIKFMIMLALILKNNIIPKKELQQDLELAEDILIDEIINMCKKNKINNIIVQTIQFTYDGKPSCDFESLRKKEIDLNKMDITVFNNKKIVEIFICMTSLSCYSDILKKLSLLFINKCFYYMRFLKVYLMAEKIFSNTKIDNQYEGIYKYTGFSKVVESYLEYGNKDLEEMCCFKQFIKNHTDEAYKELNNLKKKNVPIIIDYINILYDKDMKMDYKYVIPIIEHKLKKVVDYMEFFLSDKEKETRIYVEQLAGSKNKNTKSSIIRLIKLWDYNKISKEIDKINNINTLTKYISKIYNIENDIYIPYLKDVDISNIRIKSSNEKANEILIKCYISEYMILKDFRIIEYCNKIKKFLNTEDFRKVMKNFYTIWLNDNAESKNKNILIPYMLNCNDSDITELKKQIDIWTNSSRGELASFAVTAMSMSGSDISLLIINDISTKYKDKRVKNAAIEALNKSAQLLNISIEELADRIIPDLGFNFKKERIFDYDNRQFKAILNDKLSVSLYDESGKLIKSLPKPNLNDDTQKAEDAKEELKLLKKQLKTVISTQQNRLEKAIITERKWIRDSWEKIFVENPIMNTFAISLIWTEKDKSNNIIGTFRYMEDGSFNSCDEEEYILKDDSFISLFHPIDVNNEVLEKWQQQLDDYEIIQPIEQINMQVYTLTKDELEKDKIERFVGKNVYFSSIRSVIEKYGWKTTSIYDAGGYDGYYYEDEQLGIGVQLIFEYLYIGMDFGEKVKMCELAFYKKGTIKYESYSCDNINTDTRILPKNVPLKLMSFALMIGSLIAEKEV